MKIMSRSDCTKNKTWKKGEKKLNDDEAVEEGTCLAGIGDSEELFSDLVILRGHGINEDNMCEDIDDFASYVWTDKMESRIKKAYKHEILGNIQWKESHKCYK